MLDKNSLKTKIFLDSGDPEETKEALGILGFLDGQTTNPSLISKNPEAKKRLENGDKYSSQEVFDFYKNIVSEISQLIPMGSVSVEVYADEGTTSEEMYIQALEMNNWIPNAHIKFPTTVKGLKSAQKLVKENHLNVNMTLAFSQAQAVAVYQATKGAKKGQVFYSSFIGRLFDSGVDGINQLKNVIELYKKGDGHVEVLACSFRTLDQLLASLATGVDIATIPLVLIKEWAETDFHIPDSNFSYKKSEFTQTPYVDFDLEELSADLDITHELTTKGIEKFASDWNNLVK